MNSPPRRGLDFSQEIYDKGWYHSFELPDGRKIEGYNKLSTLQHRLSRFPIPQDLTGRRVLDIGAWDGWFSFEAEKRGASVTAVDCFAVPNFLYLRKLLSSKVNYKLLDVYELPELAATPFDYVFFLGVLYHLKHPLLALEIVCSLTTDVAIVESFVTDADTYQDAKGQVPTMEFYETDELGNQMDNWIGPSVECLLAMCRAAGFARVELLGTLGMHACIACYRKWEPLLADVSEDAPVLRGVTNTRTGGMNFSVKKEDYVSCWFQTPRAAIKRTDLRLEIGPFGIPALFVKQDAADAWMANFRLPPGLRPGWNEVRLRFADTNFGAPCRIAVDMPAAPASLVLNGVCDGADWTPNVARGTLSCWVEGLPENADRANVFVIIGGEPAPVVFCGEPTSEGYRQVNAIVPADCPAGESAVAVACGGVTSNSLPVEFLASKLMTNHNGVVRPSS